MSDNPDLPNLGDNLPNVGSDYERDAKEAYRERMEELERELEKEKKEHGFTMMGASAEAKAGDEARAQIQRHYEVALAAETRAQQMVKERDEMKRELVQLKGDRDKFLASDDCYYWSPQSQKERDELKRKLDAHEFDFDNCPSDECPVCLTENQAERYHDEAERYRKALQLIADLTEGASMRQPLYKIAREALGDK